jgi:hypothetical protein
MQHDAAPRRWWVTGLFAIAVVMPLFRGMGWLRERIILHVQLRRFD